LIHAADGAHLWAQRYDRQLTDVFAVQDEIAAAITGALSGKLTGKPVTRLHEPNLPAYDAFLKARYYQLHQLLPHAPEMPPRSEGFLKQAIALDPEWAAPHSALAHQYFSLGIHGLRPLREVVPPARLEARNALELFPPDPYARAVLGAIAAMHEYDWSEAEKEFRLAMGPGSLRPEVHIMYASYYLLPFGRFEEAIEHYVTAIKQDPLNIGSRMVQLMTLHIAGRYDRAIGEARSLLEFDDRNHVANLIIASACLHQGKSAEARQLAEEAFRLAPWHAGVVGLLAGLLAASGEEERAGNLIATMQGGMIQFGMVVYYSTCSEIDAAIDWYERAIEQRHPYAAQFACAAFFKPLRSNPRWPKLARMMNLPETA
jgi:serine/threonine-protein kinase